MQSNNFYLQLKIITLSLRVTCVCIMCLSVCGDECLSTEEYVVKMGRKAMPFVMHHNIIFRWR